MLPEPLDTPDQPGPQLKFNPDPPLDILYLSAMVQQWRKWAPKRGNYLQRLAYRLAKELLDFKMQQEIAQGVAEQKAKWSKKVKK